MPQIIQFFVSHGQTHYTATGAGFPIVTQAKTLDELMVNIEEAVELHFCEELESVSSRPPVLINYELSTSAQYAKA